MGLDQYMYVTQPGIELEEDFYDYIGEKVIEADGSEYFDESRHLFEIAYFRKSNWLHGWFDRLSEERRYSELDNCEYIVFGHEEMQRLIDDCRYVLECDSIAIAEDTLPPQKGFFFGSTAIDDYYFEDVEDALKVFEEWEGNLDVQFAYYAWW